MLLQSRMTIKRGIQMNNLQTQIQTANDAYSQYQQDLITLDEYNEIINDLLLQLSVIKQSITLYDQEEVAKLIALVRRVV